MYLGSKTQIYLNFFFCLQREKAATAEYSLDALFALEPLSEGDALKQAMGKVIDPKSGILYHLDYKPPPSNDRTYDLLDF